MSETLDVVAITKLHSHSIVQWKEQGISYQHQGLYQLVEENHAFNYQLWHEEDKARRDDMGFEFVYKAKRAIDSFNQQRNNRMEAIDEWLYHNLKPAHADTCPVHSESPGMIIDRLSILALKHYHMELQVQRTDVNDTHKHNCSQKLAVITSQRDQLQSCLQQLITEIVNKSRTFKVYHQFKMYNDPNLNPELYGTNYH